MLPFYSVQEICTIANGRFLQQQNHAAIRYLVTDSRSIQQPESVLFFALKTQHNNGHFYVPDAYKKGVRNFVVGEQVMLSELANANVILVEDTLQALQALAAFHRRQFHFPVIGITGSNGKTVVKEWLYQLLHQQFNIVRSPKSYNSQIGVPLSVWQMNTKSDLAIIEAGISTTGEMRKLENIVKPTIGVLTNIGHAHDAGFENSQQKLAEKAKLFQHAQVVIGPLQLVRSIAHSKAIFTWGTQPTATLCITSVEKAADRTTINAVQNNVVHQIKIPFTDDASIENAITCWCVCLYLAPKQTFWLQNFNQLHTVDMRLQLKHGINGCLIVNDSYSADVTSLKIALDFLEQQSSGLKRTVMLSDFADSGTSQIEVYNAIAEMLKTYSIKKIIAVGTTLANAMKVLLPEVPLQAYTATADLLANFRSSSFVNEIILIKGARKFQFEKVAQLFEKKLHQTQLEINLNALAQNLKLIQNTLQPGTRVMAMVKAFSYGSGGAEIASVLQYHNVNYLGVAYADEGVELVKAGISIPIMVMNAEAFSFQSIVDYHLQPVIYSFALLQRFEAYLQQQGLQAYPVHVELETGMNRLGFSLADAEAVARHLAASPYLSVQSVFSHLAASDDAEQDAFTLEQFKLFTAAAASMQTIIPYTFLQHIANSAAILRHPTLQLNMVRLGILLYGVDVSSAHTLPLQAVATLRSTIAQVKHLKKGESVSYNRRSVVEKDSVIATVRIGYADGYSRRFGNGAGKMLVRQKFAPVIGSVCMDMTMLDVTGIEDVKEGDEVIVFGPELPVQQVAHWIDTIPYEIMTSISQRVKRVYFHE